MNAIVQKILKQPNALVILQELSKSIVAEHTRRLEFYAWIDEHHKAEFINGQIVIHSPAKKKHLTASKLLSRLISIFGDIKKVGETYYEKAMIVLTRNDYEQDIVFFYTEKAEKFTEEQVLFPSPDFVVDTR